jgi:hypothetical protein
MGDRVSIPISESTHGILFNMDLVVCLDSSDQVISLYQLSGRELELLNEE